MLVLAHGAGAASSHPWMKAYAAALVARGFRVVTFDFDYMRAGRRAPDRAPVLEATYREVVAAVRKKFASCTLFLGGKSMGGRMASHLGAAGEPCAGLFFFGYPLHPPAKPEQRRDAHLAKIGVPMLFVQGERDPFGTKAEMSAVARRLPEAKLVVVPEGDHSFAVPKRTGLGEADVRALVCDAVAEWAFALSPPAPRRADALRPRARASVAARPRPRAR